MSTDERESSGRVLPGARPRPTVAVLLQVVAPGLGDAYNGSVRKGLGLLGVALLAGGVLTTLLGTWPGRATILAHPLA